MSRGKSAGLFTGEGEKKRGIVVEDRHDGFFGIVLIEPTTHRSQCHLVSYPSRKDIYDFLADLAWVMDYELTTKKARHFMFDRLKEAEKKLAQSRKELRELKKKNG